MCRISACIRRVDRNFFMKYNVSNLSLCDVHVSYLGLYDIDVMYGVATIRRALQIISFFCRIESLL